MSAADLLLVNNWMHYITVPSRKDVNNRKGLPTGLNLQEH